MPPNGITGRPEIAHPHTSANTCSENKMASTGEHASLYLAQSFALFWYKTVVNNGEPVKGGRYVLIGCRNG